MIDKKFWETQRTRGRGFRKLDAERVAGIKRRILDGETLAEIARDERVGSSTIGDIKSGRNWGNVSPAGSLF